MAVSRTSRAHVLVLALCTALMAGQGGRAPARTTAADDTPVLTRDASTLQDWTVRVEIGLAGLQSRRSDARQLTPPRSTITLDRAQILYPLLPDTAMSISHAERAQGKVRVEGKVLDDTPRVESGYQGMSSIAILDIERVNSTRLDVQFEIVMTSYETKIDERRARQRAWPTAEWSPPLLLCMEPQLFVETGDPAVKELVNRWTRGNPRGMGPYDLAKMLAAEVIAHVNITETPFESSSGGRVEPSGRPTAVAGFTSGYRVSGAAWSAREKRGSMYDLACLYTAVLRAAGLPARMVIGYDVDESERVQRGRPVLRAWVEFFLPRQPGQGTITPDDGEWIPVDIFKQKQFASRAPSISQPWVYFGNNTEFDRVCPLAFHWIPPTVCTNAGPAAIWGWVPDPANPGATQELRFWARPTPRRGGEPPLRRK